MDRFDGRTWMRNVAARSALAANIRFENRYAAYPHYAVLLAGAVWLFSQLPVGTDAMSVVTRSPLAISLEAALCVGGSALACALGLVGVWRPSRVDCALSLLALALCCMPWF